VRRIGPTALPYETERERFLLRTFSLKSSRMTGAGCRSAERPTRTANNEAFLRWKTDDFTLKFESVLSRKKASGDRLRLR